MPRRVVATFAVVLISCFAGPTVVASATMPTSSVVNSAPPTQPPVVTDNPFVPQRDLSDCVSALPKPDCGTDAKGGWHQTLVFAVVIAGLAFVAWRITRAVRGNRRLLEDPPDGR